MNIKKISAKSTLIQIVIFLLVTAALAFMNIGLIEKLYNSGEISKTGMIINAIIIALFFFGMLRIVVVLFSYINEHRVSLKLVEYLKENASDPISRLPEKSLAVQRFKAVTWVTKQGSPVNQAAMAASCNGS